MRSFSNSDSGSLDWVNVFNRPSLENSIELSEATAFLPVNAHVSIAQESCSVASSYHTIKDKILGKLSLSFLDPAGR